MTWKILSCEVNTAQKMKFSIKDFFSKYDQIRSLLQIWSHLLKKSLMENFIFLQWSHNIFMRKPCPPSYDYSNISTPINLMEV